MNNNRMHDLAPDETETFLARFFSFGDAVIKEFPCYPPRNGAETSYRIVFESKDDLSESGWSLVTIQFDEVSSWRFNVSLNCAFFIVSSGVFIFHDGASFYFDINNLCDPSKNIADFLGSGFHFVAHRVQWSAEIINWND